ncbi:hypothetical protein [Ureibacillus sp. GCM10028918]|uniref:hypothetical protein n=1 Tax=Ureibacillus sp. GCM10028918 TaxID=3273429 RepID=UPI0036115932
MGFLYWNLNEKEGFFRSLWTGLLALILLYFICWFFVDDFILLKIWLPIVFTLLYVLDLLVKYRRWKKVK